jgi:hypothetical protein
VKGLSAPKLGPGPGASFFFIMIGTEGLDLLLNLDQALSLVLSPSFTVPSFLVGRGERGLAGLLSSFSLPPERGERTGSLGPGEEEGKELGSSFRSVRWGWLEGEVILLFLGRRVASRPSFPSFKSLGEELWVPPSSSPVVFPWAIPEPSPRSSLCSKETPSGSPLGVSRSSNLVSASLLSFSFSGPSWLSGVSPSAGRIRSRGAFLGKVRRRASLLDSIRCSIPLLPNFG